MPHILLVDATPATLTLLQGAADSSFVLVPAESPERALELARARQPEVAVVDAELAGAPGFGLLVQLKAAVPEMEIVIVTAHAAIDWERTFDQAALIVDTVDASHGRSTRSRQVLRLGAGWSAQS